MGLFTGKVVVVTGAGNGIGRAEALAFAAEGASVVVNDVGGARDGSGTSKAADLVAEEINDGGGLAVSSSASVADLDGAESVIWSGLSRFKRVDVLVNNAGILRDRSLLNMSEAEWDSVLAVHLKGTFLMTRAFARAQKMLGLGGSVVNTTSFSGLIGNFGQANYSAAKAGIYGFTRTAALEMQKAGCRVNAIAPIALTRMTEDIPMLANVTAEQLGPQHVAPVVLWLASELAADINGRVFGVQGRKVFEYKMMQTEGIESDVPWTPEALAEQLSSFEHP